MKKIILIIAVAGAIIWLSLSVFSQCGGEQSQTKDLPDTLYSVQTGSRAYFTDRLAQDNGDVILYGYYTYEKGRWGYMDETLVLTNKYGRFKVNKRG